MHGKLSAAPQPPPLLPGIWRTAMVLTLTSRSESFSMKDLSPRRLSPSHIMWCRPSCRCQHSCRPSSARMARASRMPYLRQAGGESLAVLPG